LLLQSTGLKFTLSALRSPFLRTDAVVLIMGNPFSLSNSLTKSRDIVSCLSNNVEVDEKKATGRKIRGAGRESLTTRPSKDVFIFEQNSKIYVFISEEKNGLRSEKNSFSKR